MSDPNDPSIDRFVANLAEASFAAREWRRLEQEAERYARDFLSDDQLRSLMEVAVDDYEIALSEMHRRAAELTVRHPTEVAARYSEFDLDSNWKLWTGFCASFDPDDASWVEDDLFMTLGDVPGPSMPAFAELLSAYEDPFEPDHQAAGSVLVGRTLAAFGRALDAAGGAQVPIGVSYHGSDELVTLTPPL